MNTTDENTVAYIHLQANADKLAEACKAYVQSRNDGWGLKSETGIAADRKIRQALAAYEAAR